jgi:hypothetical protein
MIKNYQSPTAELLLLSFEANILASAFEQIIDDDEDYEAL